MPVNSPRRMLAVCLSTLGFLAGHLVVPGAASAATIAVTTTADGVPGSLRSAIGVASALAEDSIIQLAGGSTYDLNVCGADEDSNASGDLDVTGSRAITVTSLGAGLAIVRQTCSLQRVVDHLGVGTLTLDRVLITGGLAPFGAPGGGIRNGAGPLVVNRSMIQANQAGTGVPGFPGAPGFAGLPGGAGGPGANGGGIYTSSGPVTVSSSTFSGNRAGTGGTGGAGGFGIIGPGGAGGAGGPGGHGGAIASGSGPVTVTNSTLYFNFAGIGGPGNTGGGGTPGGPSGPGGAGGSGGAASVAAPLALTNTTAWVNQRGPGGIAGPGGTPGAAGAVGGILASSANLSLSASVVAGSGGSDCSSPASLESFGADGDGTCGVALSQSSGALALGAFQNNGGPTFTIRPLTSSVLVDRIPAESCPTTEDQRGVPRPQVGACEIGSVELAQPIIVGEVSPAPNAAGWNNLDATVSWSVADPLGRNVPGCASTAVTGETPGTAVTCSAIGPDGPIGSVTLIVRIDKTAPSITYDSTTPIPNAAGWNRSPTTVHWVCADGLSGPVQAVVATDVTTEGEDQDAVGTCLDAAGNSATDVRQVSIDLTAATTKIDAAPQLLVPIIGMRLTGTAHDALSGVAGTEVTFTPMGGGGGSVTIEAECLTGCGTSDATWAVNAGALAPNVYSVTAASPDVAGNPGTPSDPVMVLLV